jgi:hypothetical protein
VKSEAVDIPGSFFLEVNGLLSNGLSGSDHIGEQNYVSSLYFLPQVVSIVVKAHPALVIEESKCFPELRYWFDVEPIRTCANNDWVFDAWVNKIGADQLGRFNVEKSWGVCEAFGGAHKGIESDDFIAA